MTEIRICWNVPGRTNQDGDPIDGGAWHPDSPANREMLKVILESSIEIYGAGTYWIEARVAA